MTKLKDVSIMALNEDRIAAICGTFASGSEAKQQGFQDLVNNNIEDLRPYADVVEGSGNIKLARGASSRQRKLLEGTRLNQEDFASNYIQPSVQLAKASIEGDNSKAYQYVIDHLTEMMDPEAGDISEAPLFTPNRLAAAGKELTKKENSKFEVDADEGLLLNGKRFGSYTIEKIKLTIRTGSSNPNALDMLLQFIGMDEEETANGKEKLGTIGSFIKKMREKFRGVKGNDFAMEACEALEAAMFEVRDSLIQEMRLAAKQKQHDADMKRAARRLQREEQAGVEQEAIGASVATPEGDAAADDETEDEE